MKPSISKLTKGLLLCLCCWGSQALANGFYAGGSVGNARLGLSSSDSNIDISGSDIGYKVFGGFKFTFLAVEGGYVNFGQIDGDNENVKVSGLSAFGMLSTGLGPVSLFGKVGGFIWDSDVRSATESYSEDGFDPALGLGAAFNMGNLGLRAEYEYFNISEFDDVSMFSVGAVFRF